MATLERMLTLAIEDSSLDDDSYRRALQVLRTACRPSPPLAATLTERNGCAGVGVGVGVGVGGCGGRRRVPS